MKNVVSSRGKNSLRYFLQAVKSACRIRKINIREIEKLAQFIVNAEIKNVVTRNVCVDLEDMTNMVNFKGRFMDLTNTSMKVIGEGLIETFPKCIMKLGAILIPNESLTWDESLRKVNSVRGQSVHLKVAHGDVYTKERLFRYGLSESLLCLRCNAIETLNHKIIECDYVTRIWAATQTNGSTACRK